MAPDHEAESRLRMDRLFTATARQPGRGPGTVTHFASAFAALLASYDPPGVTPEQHRVLFRAFAAGYAAAIAEMEAVAQTAALRADCPPPAAGPPDVRDAAMQAWWRVTDLSGRRLMPEKLRPILKTRPEIAAMLHTLVDAWLESSVAKDMGHGCYVMLRVSWEHGGDPKTGFTLAVGTEPLFDDEPLSDD